MTAGVKRLLLFVCMHLYIHMCIYSAHIMCTVYVHTAMHMCMYAYTAHVYVCMYSLENRNTAKSVKITLQAINVLVYLSL